MKTTENVTVDFKALREQAGLTLEALAGKIDYSVAAVNGLENTGAGSRRLRNLVLGTLNATVSGETNVPPADENSRDPTAAAELALARENTRSAEQKLARVYALLAEVLQVLQADPSAGVPAEKPASRRLMAAAKPRRARMRDVANVSLRIFGTIPAGWPQNFDEARHPVRHERIARGRFPEGAFGLDVRGDSMNASAPEPILDGETVILVSPEQREPRHNDIVAALCDGQTTLKRLQCLPDGKFVLRAESSHPAFAREIVPAQELTIQGVVVGKL